MEGRTWSVADSPQGWRRTNVSERLFEALFHVLLPKSKSITDTLSQKCPRLPALSLKALFKCVSTRFGLRNIEQSIGIPDFVFFPPSKSSFGEHKLCKMIQKIVATCDVLVFWDATIFCNNSMLPKQRFWKEEQKRKSGFSTDFSMVRSQNPVLTPLKIASNIWFHLLFLLPKSSFGMDKLYAPHCDYPQTKILEG
jgi:hypothetical protein